MSDILSILNSADYTNASVDNSTGVASVKETAKQRAQREQASIDALNPYEINKRATLSSLQSNVGTQIQDSQSKGGDEDYQSALGYVGNKTTADIDEQVAQMQQWYHKMGNATINNLVIAGTSFVDGTLGLADGIVEAMATGEMNKLWNNTVSNLDNDIRDEAAKKFQVYKTQEYQDAGNFEKMGSIDFWADLWQNMGFTEGMALSAMAYGGVAGKMFSGLKAAMTKSPILERVLGGLTGAIGEAATEAVGHKTEEFNSRSKALTDAYNKAMAESAEEDKPALTAKFQKDLAKTEDDLKREGNMVFLSNIGLLSLTNSIQFGNLFSKGYDSSRKIALQIGKDGLAHGTSKVAFNTGLGAKVLLNNCSEAFEEGSQDIIKEGAPIWRKMQDAEYDDESRNVVKSYLDSLIEGVRKIDKKELGLDMLMGFVTGAVGTPSLKGWSGGIYGEISEGSKEWREQQDLVNRINERLKADSKFGALYKGIVAHNALEKKKTEAAQNGNRVEWENADFQQMISDVQMFRQAMLMDVYKKRIQESANLTDEEVAGVIKENPENWKNEDGTTMNADQVRTKVADKVNKQLAAIDEYGKFFDKFENEHPELNADCIEGLSYLEAAAKNRKDRAAEIFNDATKSVIRDAAAKNPTFLNETPELKAATKAAEEATKKWEDAVVNKKSDEVLADLDDMNEALAKREELKAANSRNGFSILSDDAEQMRKNIEANIEAQVKYGKKITEATDAVNAILNQELQEAVKDLPIAEQKEVAQKIADAPILLQQAENIKKEQEAIIANGVWANGRAAKAAADATKKAEKKAATEAQKKTTEKQQKAAELAKGSKDFNEFCKNVDANRNDLVTNKGFMDGSILDDTQKEWLDKWKKRNKFNGSVRTIAEKLVKDKEASKELKDKKGVSDVVVATAKKYNDTQELINAIADKSAFENIDNSKLSKEDKEAAKAMLEMIAVASVKVNGMDDIDTSGIKDIPADFVNQLVDLGKSEAKDGTSKTESVKGSTKSTADPEALDLSGIDMSIFKVGDKIAVSGKAFGLSTNGKGRICEIIEINGDSFTVQWKDPRPYGSTVTKTIDPQTQIMKLSKDLEKRLGDAAPKPAAKETKVEGETTKSSKGLGFGDVIKARKEVATLPTAGEKLPEMSNGAAAIIDDKGNTGFGMVTTDETKEGHEAQTLTGEETPGSRGSRADDEKNTATEKHYITTGLDEFVRFTDKEGNVTCTPRGEYERKDGTIPYKEFMDFLDSIGFSKKNEVLRQVSEGKIPSKVYFGICKDFPEFDGNPSIIMFVRSEDGTFYPIGNFNKNSKNYEAIAKEFAVDDLDFGSVKVDGGETDVHFSTFTSEIMEVFCGETNVLPVETNLSDFAQAHNVNPSDIKFIIRRKSEGSILSNGVKESEIKNLEALVPGQMYVLIPNVQGTYTAIATRNKRISENPEMIEVLANEIRNSVDAIVRENLSLKMDNTADPEVRAKRYETMSQKLRDAIDTISDQIALSNVAIHFFVSPDGKMFIKMYRKKLDAAGKEIYQTKGNGVKYPKQEAAYEAQFFPLDEAPEETEDGIDYDDPAKAIIQMLGKLGVSVNNNVDVDAEGHAELSETNLKMVTTNVDPFGPSPIVNNWATIKSPEVNSKGGVTVATDEQYEATKPVARVALAEEKEKARQQAIDDLRNATQAQLREAYGDPVFIDSMFGGSTEVYFVEQTDKNGRMKKVPMVRTATEGLVPINKSDSLGNLFKYFNGTIGMSILKNIQKVFQTHDADGRSYNIAAASKDQKIVMMTMDLSDEAEEKLKKVGLVSYETNSEGKIINHGAIRIVESKKGKKYALFQAVRMPKEYRSMYESGRKRMNAALEKSGKDLLDMPEFVDDNTEILINPHTGRVFTEAETEAANNILSYLFGSSDAIDMNSARSKEARSKAEAEGFKLGSVAKPELRNGADFRKAYKKGDKREYAEPFDVEVDFGTLGKSRKVTVADLKEDRMKAVNLYSGFDDEEDFDNTPLPESAQVAQTEEDKDVEDGFNALMDNEPASVPSSSPVVESSDVHVPGAESKLYVETKQEAEEDSVPDLSKIIDLSDLPSLDDEAPFRVATNKTTEVWNQEAELAILDQMLPQLSREGKIDIVHGLITEGSTKAWGQTKGAHITLSDIAAPGTAYHEAFHVVFRNYLSAEERNTLLQEAKAKYGEMSNLELEECMAEDFRRYVASNGKLSFSQRIAKFFKQLLAKITHTEACDTVMANYFDAIRSGKYARKTNTSESLEIASNLDVKMTAGYNTLSPEEKAYLGQRKISKDEYDNMSDWMKEMILKCM